MSSSDVSDISDLTGIWKSSDGLIQYIRIVPDSVGNKYQLWAAKFSDVNASAWCVVTVGKANATGTVYNCESVYVPKGSDYAKYANAPIDKFVLNTAGKGEQAFFDEAIVGSKKRTWSKATRDILPPGGGIKDVYPSHVPKLDASLSDPTGAWKASDRGVYYIKYIKSAKKIFALGMSDDGGGNTWTNVFVGDVSGSSAAVTWIDLPRGINMVDWPNITINFHASEKTLTRADGMTFTPAIATPGVADTKSASAKAKDDDDDDKKSAGKKKPADPKDKKIGDPKPASKPGGKAELAPKPDAKVETKTEEPPSTVPDLKILLPAILIPISCIIIIVIIIVVVMRRKKKSSDGTSVTTTSSTS